MSYEPPQQQDLEKRRLEARKRAQERRDARFAGERSSATQKRSLLGRGSGGGRGSGRTSQSSFGKSATITFCVLVVFVLVAVARLFYFTVIDGPHLAELAANGRTNVQTILAKRGTIYDRNGNVLATSVECKTVYANTTIIKNKDAAAAILSETLGGDEELYRSELEPDSTFIFIERKVDATKAEKCVNELAEQNIDGIYTLQDMKRVYPYENVAAQVLGVVGTDGYGLSGLELQYNSVLAGQNGEITMEMGRDGTPIAGGAYQETPAQNGTDIVISLDINIQQIAEQKIVEAQDHYSAKSGMVTVTNPQNGEILAMCSTPLLDPNNLDNDAMQLKCVSQSEEPGSVLKILTCAIGEEAGDFTNNTVYSVPDEITVGEHTVHDEEKRSGTEDMTPREIMRMSSNIGAVLLGRSIGVPTFRGGLNSFGIGQKTGIDYPGEETGIVPTAEKMSETDLSYMSFGQSLAIPQIQLVRAVNAIANKGTLTTPHFLVYKGTEEVSWPDDGQACSEQTAENITSLMRTVVESGTAKTAGVEGYDVAAKTGTGEQAEGSAGYANSSYLATLVGFAPASDAKVSVCVSLSGVAYLAAESSAPVFSSIMSESLLDLGIAPSQ